MSRGRDNWYLEMEWPEPTQNTTIINNYYYYGGNNCVESNDDYNEEWDGDDEDYDEEYDEEEDYDEDGEYDDEDEEDCEDDDYEVTNRNNTLPAPAAPVVNNNIRVNSTTYNQTTYGDINVFIQNNQKMLETAKIANSLTMMGIKMATRALNTDLMQDIDNQLAKAAASAVITGRKEAAVVSLAADAIRKISKQFIG